MPTQPARGDEPPETDADDDAILDSIWNNIDTGDHTKATLNMVQEPNCYSRGCKHFLGVSPDEDEEQQVPICAAFPKGIPSEIAYGDNLHIEPVEGDHGIQFEQEDVAS